ncbi:MAG: TOTE conflict system archaeo-eukaryotic primase domain-containing protein [Armatimonadota bacterium]
MPEVLATGLTRCGACDFDGGAGHSDPLQDALGAALATYDALHARGIPAYLVRSNSGEGYHLWVWWEEWTPVEQVRHVLSSLVREALADDTEWAKVEVNPKAHRSTATRGLPIAIPWRAHSHPGCNVLIDPQTGMTMQLPPGGTFARVTAAQMSAWLAAVPPVPAPMVSVPTPPRRETARHEGARDTPLGAESWYARIKGDRRLIEFTYGDYLTGEEGDPWLVCRDPFSPTGDRTPSAGVHRDSGVFNSLRTDTSTDILAMLVRLGKAADREAACRVAEEVTGLLRAHTAATRFPYGRKMVPDEEPRLPAPEPLLLEEAQRVLEQLVTRQILPTVRARGQAVHLIKAGTGAGKSYSLGHLCRAIAQGTIMGEDGQPIRALWLTHSRDKIDEVMRDYLADTHGRLLPGVVRAYPRSKVPEDPGYCAHYERARQLSEHRQSVAQTLCPPCRRQRREQGDTAWAALTPTEQRHTRKSELREGCPYQEHLKTLDDPTVRVVVGVRHSFQHGDDRVKPFDLVIIDEEAEAAFLQAITVDLSALATWEHRQTRDTALWADVHPVLSVLKRALVAGPAEGLEDTSRPLPALPLLRRLDPEFDERLGALAARLQLQAPWERGTPLDIPTADEVWEGQEPIPLRGLLELVDTLALEARARRPVRDTRVWLTPQTEKMPGSLRCWLTRDALIARLQSKVTVFLDATAHLPTMQRLFGGGLQVHIVPLKTYTHITLFGDALYRTQDLARTQWRKPALYHALNLFCQQYARPLVVCPLGLEKELKSVLPAHVELTHWYAGDMAGANTYEECDAVALIGHPRPPEDLIIQQVQALRWLDTWDDHPPAEGTPDPAAAVERPVPVEGFIDADGRGWARLATYAEDPEIFDLAQHRYSMAPIQAIGRVRPGKPRPQRVPVWLLMGEPPRDLPIDALTTLAAWLREHDPAYLRAHPYPHLHATAASTVRQAQREHMKAALLMQYVDAAEGLHRDGVPVSSYSLQRVVGGSYSTASAYLPRVLETLAVRHARRSALETAAREVLRHYRIPLLRDLAYAAASAPIQADWQQLSTAEAEALWLRKRFGREYRQGQVPADAANYARARELFRQDEEAWQQLCVEWDALLPTLTPVDPATDPRDEMTEDEWRAWRFTCWWDALSLQEATVLLCEKLDLLDSVQARPPRSMTQPVLGLN